MESQQIVDYIGQHLSAGHTEANLGQHLLTQGWSQAAVNDAFARYHQSRTPDPSAKPVTTKKKPRPRIKRPKWSLARWAKVVAVIILIAVGVHIFISHRAAHKPAPHVAQHLSYEARQANDVTTVAGAVGQYSAANGTLPSSLSVAPDGNLVLCGATCDPTTSEVSSLVAYEAPDVKMQPYAPGLTVPDNQIMYLVPGAKCAGGTSIGGPSTVTLSMVILFAQLDGSTLAQRCVTL